MCTVQRTDVWNSLLKCKISCLHYISLLQVFENQIQSILLACTEFSCSLISIWPQKVPTKDMKQERCKDAVLGHFLKWLMMLFFFGAVLIIFSQNRIANCHFKSFLIYKNKIQYVKKGKNVWLVRWTSMTSLAISSF